MSGKQDPASSGETMPASPPEDDRGMRLNEMDPTTINATQKSRDEAAAYDVKVAVVSYLQKALKGIGEIDAKGKMQLSDPSAVFTSPKAITVGPETVPDATVKRTGRSAADQRAFVQLMDAAFGGRR